MSAAKVNVGSGSPAEGVVDLTVCAPVPISAQEDTLDLTVDTPKTPNDQLRKVFDLSQESTIATYEWMRLVSCFVQEYTNCILFLVILSLRVLPLILCVYTNYRCAKPATKRNLFGDSSRDIQLTLYNDVRLKNVPSLRLTSSNLQREMIRVHDGESIKLHLTSICTSRSPVPHTHLQRRLRRKTRLDKFLLHAKKPEKK